MVTFVAGGFGVDFDQFDVSTLIVGSVTVRNGGQFSTTDSGVTDNIFGNLTYNGAGDLAGGVITRVQETYLGQLVFDMTGLTLAVPTFLGWVAADNGSLARATILAGADSILGSPDQDVLRAMTGSDTVAGGLGGDVLDGGDGDDVVNGDGGDDVITDPSGSNYLRGDDGNDLVRGGSGFDDINGNRGDDTGYGGLGDDWVVGGKDQDQLYGEDGNDIVYGNLGNDTCDGGVGDDLVRGGQ